MKDLLNYIKSHKVLVFILVFAFFFPLLIVYFCFAFPTNSWYKVKWSAGDMLGYIAGFETLLGTLILGFLTLAQTKQIEKDNSEQQEKMQKENIRLQKENNRLQKENNSIFIKESRLQRENTNRPFFVIDEIIIKDEFGKDNIISDFNINSYITAKSPYLTIYLKNVGEGVANHCYNINTATMHNKEAIKCVLKNSLYCIECQIGENDESIEISYENIVGIRYIQTITIYTVDMPKEDYDNTSTTFKCFISSQSVLNEDE